MNELLVKPRHRMGSKAIQLLLRAMPNSRPSPTTRPMNCSLGKIAAVEMPRSNHRFYAVKSSLEPPDVQRLAETTRISLTSQEVEEFAPKVRQVVDWFGQLQAVDLRSIEPAIRADTEGDNVRDDEPQVFDNRDAILSAIPTFEDPYIKVPKVLKKE